MRLTNPIIALAFVVLAPAETRAVTTVSNLGSPFNLSGRILETQAVAFTVGDVPATLNSATVALGAIGPDGTNLSAAIRSDASGLPDTILESLPTQLVDLVHPPNPTFPSAGLSLAPHTTYWLVVTSDHFAQWAPTNTDETSAYGWTIGDHMLYLVDGVWATDPTHPTVVGRLSIDATILPEPATVALAALPCLALRRRRRQGPNVPSSSTPFPTKVPGIPEPERFVRPFLRLAPFLRPSIFKWSRPCLPVRD